MVPRARYFNEINNEVITIEEQVLTLEHSLFALAQWESKWKKPFLGEENKTMAECIDYVRCMCITPDVHPLVFCGITPAIFEEIDAYIKAQMTATWFRNDKTGKKNHDVITAEIVYYWMVSLHIPFECQMWHLNRLLALIRVCDEKNGPQKKMNRKDVYNRNRALNAERRKRLNSKG
jgi:hypothetical protein